MIGGAVDFTVDATGLFPGSVTFSTMPGTILRMLGEYVIFPTSAPAAGDEATLTVGIGIVSTDAFNAGSGSVPEPRNDSFYPWLYWASHMLAFSGTGTDPSQAGGSVRKVFDIGSMRKVKPGESLVLVGEYVNITGNPPLTLAVGDTRVLFGS